MICRQKFSIFLKNIIIFFKKLYKKQVNILMFSEKILYDSSRPADIYF